MPADVLVEARHMAVDERMSLSRFVASALEDRVRSRRAYQVVRARQLRALDGALPSGTNG